MSDDPSSGLKAPQDTLGGALTEARDARFGDWLARSGTPRLLARDATLFSGADEASWMGWLEPTAAVEGLDALRADLEGPLAAVQTVFLLGMGGSSLGSEVVYRTLEAECTRRLVVLDTTNPETVGPALDTADPQSSLVIAASKSGSTLETAALLELFWERFGNALGDAVGRHFVAVTDPGSAFEARAKERNFGHVFLGDPAIGGRFSVLSPFGLVPAVAIGLDVERLVAPAAALARELAAAPLEESAIGLGLTLAAAHEAGRNKVTLITSPSLRSFGTWLEQLLAESTGKHGVGIVPVDGEPISAAAELGPDRLVVSLAVAGEAVAAVDGLEESDVPRIPLELPDPYALGAAFYRWQIATAVVGAELGLNPFDQPDVESAKVATRRIVDHLEDTSGGVPAEPALFSGEGDPEEVLSSLLEADDAGSGTYFAVLAYLPMTPHVHEALASVRRLVLTARGWATCLGFGPRYLHSTGQAHKGGPPQGRFLVLTTPSADARRIPGMDRQLAGVHHAQAMGDLEVLRQRGRPAAHLELRGDLEEALDTLIGAVESAL